jgi:hypothetical protein
MLAILYKVHVVCTQHHMYRSGLTLSACKISNKHTIIVLLTHYIESVVLSLLLRILLCLSVL